MFKPVKTTFYIQVEGRCYAEDGTLSDEFFFEPSVTIAGTPHQLKFGCIASAQQYMERFYGHLQITMKQCGGEFNPFFLNADSVKVFGTGLTTDGTWKVWFSVRKNQPQALFQGD